jgi:transposase
VRTRQRHAAIHQLLADGRTVQAAASELGLARNTVRRFARAVSPDELLVHDGTGRRASILDEHKAYLRERWNCLVRRLALAAGRRDSSTGPARALHHADSAVSRLAARRGR